MPTIRERIKARIDRADDALTKRIRETIGAVSTDQMNAAKSRAFEAGFFDGRSGNDDPASGDIARGGFGYRRLGRRGLREMGEADPRTIMEIAWKLYQSSPLAMRLVRIKRGFVLGSGVSPSTEDESLQPIIDEFWERNELDKQRQYEFTEQLELFGEQIFPAFVRDADGMTMISYIDPAAVTTVFTHPGNPMEMWAVGVGDPDVDEDAEIFRVIRKDTEHAYFSETGQAVMVPANYPGLYVTAEQATLQPWELKLLARFGQSEYSGSVFLTQINKVSNQSRGSSGLQQLLDWIDKADQILFSLGDRETYAGFFSWDVELTGANPDQVSQRATAIRNNPPLKGSVNVHNDMEAWQMIAPDLHQGGTVTTFEAYITFIAGGYGIPTPWLGFGNQTNRATLAEQNSPTFRQLEDDQRNVKNMFLYLCEFARDQANIAGAWSPTEGVSNDITFDMPEMSVRDLGSIITHLSPLAVSMTQAVTQGWQSPETAANVWAKMLGELGIEVNAADEMSDPDPDALAVEAERNVRLSELLEGIG